MLMGRFLCLCLTTSTANGLRASATPSFTPRIHLQRNFLNGRAMSFNDQESSVGLGDIGNSTGSEDLTWWRTRIDASIAMSRKIRGGNFVQIATVDPTTNEPRCRTVVFRGFQKVDHASIECDGKPCVMKMITDNRSNKVSEATNNDAVSEMVWWFSKSSEQYRIRGKLMFVGNGQYELDKELESARMQQWGNLSDPAREQFFWKEPGIPYSGESAVPEGGRDKDGNVLPPPDSFLLMLLFPTRVDYLRLGDNFRQIDEITDGSRWTLSRVNP